MCLVRAKAARLSCMAVQYLLWGSLCRHHASTRGMGEENENVNLATHLNPFQNSGRVDLVGQAGILFFFWFE